MTERDRILSRLTALAQADPAIRGMLLIGSHSRPDSPADQWSDIDIIVVATDPAPYLRDDWLEDLGPILLSMVEKAAIGHTRERRLLLSSGQDLDIVPISGDQFHSALQSSDAGDIHDVIAAGKWLADKDGLSLVLPVAADRRSGSPTSDELDDVVQDFWFHAVWTAKKLRRGEIWVALSCCDGYLKNLLLRMIEWHSRIVYGPNHNTWFRGRFIERWARPEVVDRLAATYATYNRSSIESALLSTTELFDDVAGEIAKSRSILLPDGCGRAKALMMAILNEEGRAEPERRR